MLTCRQPPRNLYLRTAAATTRRRRIEPCIVGPETAAHSLTSGKLAHPSPQSFVETPVSLVLLFAFLDFSLAALLRSFLGGRAKGDDEDGQDERDRANDSPLPRLCLEPFEPLGFRLPWRSSTWTVGFGDYFDDLERHRYYSCQAIVSFSRAGSSFASARGYSGRGGVQRRSLPWYAGEGGTSIAARNDSPSLTVPHRKPGRTDTMPGGRKISSRQEAALAALLTEPTVKAASAKAGIGRATLERWLKEPDFEAAYRAARCRLLASAVAGLSRLAGVAVRRLRRLLLKSKDEKVQLGACRATLEFAGRFAEVVDIAARLDRIEAAQAAEAGSAARGPAVCLRPAHPERCRRRRQQRQRRPGVGPDG